MVRNKQEGFTLIELMIVVSIIGILAAIALPQIADAIHHQRSIEIVTWPGHAPVTVKGFVNTHEGGSISFTTTDGVEYKGIMNAEVKKIKVPTKSATDTKVNRL